MSAKRFRKVDPRIWNDYKFTHVSFCARFLFLFFLTHQNLTILGMLKIHKENLAVELGLSNLFDKPFDKTLSEGFDELVDAGLIEYDSAGLVVIKNFIKYNPPDNQNIVKSWGKGKDFLPECPLFYQHLKRLKRFCRERGDAYLKAFDSSFSEIETVPETVTQTVPETVTQTVPETVTQTIPETVTQTREKIEDRKIEEKKETYKERKPPNAFSIPKPPDVTDQTWNDFVQLRKVKKAPVTETCIQGFRREAEKADITLEAALSVTVLHGWQGFKADWLRNKNRQSNGGYAKPPPKTNQRYDDVCENLPDDFYPPPCAYDLRDFDLNGKLIKKEGK